MANYKMVVFSQPVEGKETEYNDWYQNVHLKELVAFNGFKSARRYRRAHKVGNREAHPYIAEYHIETDDIEGVLSDFYQAAEDGRITMSDALDREDIQAAVYEEFGARVDEA